MKLNSPSTSSPVVTLRISTSIRNRPLTASRLASDTRAYTFGEDGVTIVA